MLYALAPYRYHVRLSPTLDGLEKWTWAVFRRPKDDGSRVGFLDSEFTARNSTFWHGINARASFAEAAGASPPTAIAGKPLGIEGLALITPNPEYR